MKIRERGIRGFDGHKRVKGRKCLTLVDTNGFFVSCRVETVGMFHREAARFLTAGLAPLWRSASMVKPAAICASSSALDQLCDRDSQPDCGAYFVWLSRHRRLSKNYEFRLQTSAALIAVAACAPMLKRIAPS